MSCGERQRERETGERHRDAETMRGRETENVVITIFSFPLLIIYLVRYLRNQLSANRSLTCGVSRSLALSHSRCLSHSAPRVLHSVAVDDDDNGAGDDD